MTTIGAYEAKTHFSQLIERVAKGERITITRHNVPIATLQPVSSQPAAPPEEIVAQIKAFRRNYRLDGLSVQEMKEEGRAS
jgi:prevent-host-death family protein